MENWYNVFASALLGGQDSRDLIGAGTVSAKKAIAHYRYQQKEKVREAIEDTFPSLRRLASESWSELWNSFYTQNRNSPRSLDFISQVFLNFIQDCDVPIHWKELAKFEYALEVHPWSHRQLEPVSLVGISKDSRLFFGEIDVQTFNTAVVEIYEEQIVEVLARSEKILIWLISNTVHYRRMEAWELHLLENLSHGVEKAMEYAPDDAEAVEKFFLWLGQSNLVQEIR